MNKKFIQQTHFIGVIPPDSLVNTLEDCRNYMSYHYGCKSGYGTPIHITLIPPFTFEEKRATENILLCVKNVIENLKDKKLLPFKIEVNRFGNFGNRTIFAHTLPSQKWTQLRNDLYRELSGNFPEIGLKKDTRPFQPHLTVANRDIPEDKIFEALQYFSTLNLETEFLIDNVSVFTKFDRRWILEEENSLPI